MIDGCVGLGGGGEVGSSGADCGCGRGIDICKGISIPGMLITMLLGMSVTGSAGGAGGGGGGGRLGANGGGIGHVSEESAVFGHVRMGIGGCLNE